MMTIKKFVSSAVLTTLISSPILAEQFTAGASYNVCYTPGGSCTDLIVSAIKSATQSLRVQAYSFTSVPIIDAITEANHRGVDVKVILDKSDFSGAHPVSKTFLDDKIPVWEDIKVDIAHNKVIVIDNAVVVTGSFNFSAAAQVRNAENVIIISDVNLAQKYTLNWESRQAASIQK